MNSLVSIITPNFNNEEYIKETAESVITQTYNNWEWLIIDDGSVDNSPGIIDEYLKRDKRIKFLNRSRLPKGPSTCRNIGIECSNGEYIIFLDGDDLLADYCLEKRLELIQNTEYDFCVFPIGLFYIKPGDKGKQFNKYFSSKECYLKSFIEFNPAWQTMGPIWRKEFLLKIGGFDEELIRLTDPDIHTRALLIPDVKFKLFEFNMPDCFYRQRENHKNEQWLENVITGHTIFQKKVYKHVENKHIENSIKVLVIKSLQKSLLNFYKNWILIRVSKFKDLFYEHLFWAYSNKLINKKNYFLLFILGKLWQNNNVIVKVLKVKGWLYKFIK